MSGLLGKNRKMKGKMVMAQKSLGIDLERDTIIIYDKDNGTITIETIESDDRQYSAEMLSALIPKTVQRDKLKNYGIGISVPDSFDEEMKKTVTTTVEKMAAKEINYVDKNLAAAYGADIDIESPFSKMIVYIGADMTKLSIFAKKQITYEASCKTGLVDIDDALITFFKEKQGLLVGRNVAKSVREKVGTVFERAISMDIRGRSLSDGYPKTLQITAEMTREVYREVAVEIVQLIKNALGNISDIAGDDVTEKGIVLVGEGSMLHGLSELIEAETGTSVVNIENPVTAAAIGAARVVGNV